MDRLKKRSDFLRARRGNQQVRRALVAYRHGNTYRKVMQRTRRHPRWRDPHWDSLLQKSVGNRGHSKAVPPFAL